MTREHSANNSMDTNTNTTITDQGGAALIGSGPSLGSHESSRKENDRWIYIRGYTLTNDHATTGRDWFRLVDKTTGEKHSGPDIMLWQIFLGRKTIEDLYA